MNAALVRYFFALAYALLISFSYRMMSNWWDYLGYSYKVEDTFLVLVACALGAAPAILLKARPKTFSQSAAWIIYLLIFLPACVIPVMQAHSGTDRSLLLLALVAMSCTLFILIANQNVARIKPIPVNRTLFWWLLLGFWAGSLIYILYFFGSSFRFVALSDIYDQRFSSSAVLSDSAVVRYLNLIISNAIAPFFVAYGLLNKKYGLVAIGIVTQVMLFGTLAARATLVSPLFVIGLWWITARLGIFDSKRLMKAALVLLIITAPFLFIYDPNGGGINSLLTFLYFRTLLISGAMVGNYEQIFDALPLTYYSNNNIVSYFIDYPFDNMTIGQVVMIHLVPSNYWEFDLGQFNANFLATDGIAALGLWGVPFAGVLASGALLGLNKLIPEGRDTLMTAASAVFLLTLANTSLLTSLVSGGGVLVALLIAISPHAPSAKQGAY